MPSDEHRDSIPSSGYTKPGAVLVVDDDESLRALVVKWLSKSGLACVEARSGEEAIARAVEMVDGLDAIVCDVMMPGLDGFGVLERLKGNEATARIPVIMLTAHANADADMVRGSEGGAVDHVEKPFSGPVLAAKVRAVVARSRSEKTLRARLAFAETHATVDALTGLFNRRHFQSRLKGEVSHARRHQRPLALVMLDLDHFKAVNDTFGHEGGDRVLQHVAKGVVSVLRTEDAAFRYGGEEFAILLRDCDAASAVAVIDRLRSHLKATEIALGPGAETRAITFSAGVASAEARNDFAAADLVSRADRALYRAKGAGRDRTETE